MPPLQWRHSFFSCQFEFYLYFCSRNETRTEHIIFGYNADTDAYVDHRSVGGEVFVHRPHLARPGDRPRMLLRRRQLHDPEVDAAFRLRACLLGKPTGAGAASDVHHPMSGAAGCHRHGVASKRPPCRNPSGTAAHYSYCAEGLIPFVEYRHPQTNPFV